MILYHGSTVRVEMPELRGGVSLLDFGAGFYTTSSYEQAERWARIKMRRENVRTGAVSAYEFDFEKAQTLLRIRRFMTADRAWLDFVVQNRRGAAPTSASDLLIGPVADDNVYQSIRLFETGVFDAEETVKRLKTEVLHDQWTFLTQDALALCRFIGATEIKEEPQP